MISLRITNETKRCRLVFVEPEAADFWQEPREAFELRADGDPVEGRFDIVQTEEGLTIFPEGVVGPILVFREERELSCGYQRPADW